MLMRQTFAYLPAQLAGIVIQLAALLVWSHLLSAGELGVFTLMIAFQELVFAPALLWWTNYTRRYLTGYGGAAERDRFDGSDQIVLVVSIVAQVAIVASLVPVVTSAPASMELIFAVIGFTLTRNVALHVANRAIAEGRPLTFAILQTGSQALGLGLGVVALATVGAGAETLLAAYVAAQLAALIATRSAMAHLFRRHAYDRRILHAALRYGGPLVCGSLLAWTGNHAIRFLVDHELGAEAVGLLAIGWMLGLKAAEVSSMLVVVPAFTLAVERNRAQGRNAALRQMAQNGALLLAVLVPAVVGLVMVSETVVELLVADAFREATATILPLAAVLGAIRAFEIHFVSQTFLLFERTATLMKIGVFEALATLLGCLVGLKLGGLVGAVLGCLIVDAVGLGICAAIARRLFGLYLVLADVARIAGATMVMTGVLLLLPAEPTYLGLALQIVLGGLSYVAVLTAFYASTLRGALRPSPSG